MADFNKDGVLDIVTAEKGAPNMLYLGDPARPELGDYTTVTAARPMLPIPIALRDAPTWYESAYAGTDVATGASIGGTERAGFKLVCTEPTYGCAAAQPYTVLNPPRI